MKNKGLIYGFKSYFSAFKTLLTTPALLRLSILPTLVNLVILIAVFSIGYYQYGNLVDYFRPQDPAWWQTLLYWLTLVTLPLLFLVILFYAFVTVACIVASPFLELLASKYLSTLDPEGSYKFDFPFLKTMWEESKKIISLLLIAIIALPLNFIPVVGQVLYYLVSVLMFAFEFLDYPMSISSWPFKKRYKALFGNLLISIGLGSAITITFIIPIIGFFCLPVSTIAATKIFYEMKTE